MLFSPIRHRGRLYLRSLCVVLTINQPLQGCAAVIGAALPRLNGTTLVVIRLFGNFVAVKRRRCRG